MKKNLYVVLTVLFLIAQFTFIPQNNTSQIIETSIPLSAPNIDLSATTSTAIISINQSKSTLLGANDSVIIDTAEATDGIISVQTRISTDKRLKFGVFKDGKSIYYDILPIDNVTIPLQLGNGYYSFQLFQNVANTSYTRIFTQNLSVTIEKQDDVFLNPSKIVDYASSSDLDSLMESIIPSESDDRQKLQAAYDYIVHNFKYDYSKIPTLTSTYIPNVDDTINTQKGICYDFSVLLASILRNQGIPTKVIMGNSTYTPNYHAWNEVLIDGEWIIIDTTLDAISQQDGFPYQMAKNESDYTIDLYY